MDDQGSAAQKVAVGNKSDTSPAFDAARSRRRFRVGASLVVLLVAVGGYAVLSRTQEAIWYLPADFKADPASSSVTIFVKEQGCTSGQAPSITKPQVELGASSVTIAVRTRERLALSGSCPGNPLTPVTVQLGEPLGNRVLIDAYGDLRVEPTPPDQGTASFVPPLAADR